MNGQTKQAPTSAQLEKLGEVFKASWTALGLERFTPEPWEFPVDCTPEDLWNDFVAKTGELARRNDAWKGDPSIFAFEVMKDCLEDVPEVVSFAERIVKAICLEWYAEADLFWGDAYEEMAATGELNGWRQRILQR